MGMFDRLICDMPLPGGEANNPHGDHFHTKGLDCDLGVYRITEDSRLVCEKPGRDCGESGPRDEFHGFLNFYTCAWNGKDWREYRAKFTDGKCVGIEKVISEDET